MSDDVDIDADDAELGFGPAVSTTGAVDDTGTTTTSKRRARNRRSRLRRKIGAGAVLFGALASMGGAYAMFASSSGAAASGAPTAADVAAGREIYQTSCIACHGANLEGVNNQGPSLVGTGEAAVYFQVSSGYMPLAQQGAEAPRKPVKYTDAQINQLAAFVQSLGGGPTLPADGTNLRSASSGIAQGGELFRLNCASCHGTTFKGAPLSAGKSAPSLNPATDRQILAAMLSGPESMPVFSDNQITPAQKSEIITYIQTLKASKDPGGSGIDRVGPVSEAIVIWVAGVGGLMLAILWIGARVR